MTGTSNQRRGLLVAMLAGVLLKGQAQANEHIFTYTYEPETLPAGAREFEQWATLRAGRNAMVGQKDYQRWEIRDEFEYGVTDNYTLSLYLNGYTESFRNPESGQADAHTEFSGISMENRYLVLDPAHHAVGLTLYLEPTLSRDGGELEQKIILGQRQGDWKWAVNLTHATEWADSFHETEGEVELTAGLARYLGTRWTLGVEARDHNELPEYKEWENTAVFLGPTASYRRENWWATLGILPQLYGKNYTGNPDGNSRLELEGHERVNTRLLFGVSF